MMSETGLPALALALPLWISHGMISQSVAALSAADGRKA